MVNEHCLSKCILLIISSIVFSAVDDFNLKAKRKLNSHYDGEQTEKNRGSDAKVYFKDFRPSTSVDKNNGTNDKFYRKVAILMYTEMFNFRPQS